MRPDDVKPWRQCFRETFAWVKWLGGFMLVFTPAMVWTMNHYLVSKAQQAQFDTFFFYAIMEAVPIYMISALMISGAMSLHNAPTPKEREARDREMLALLKETYEANP